MSTYAFSDLHGCWNHFEEILKLTKPEDRVYCLGDCGDRGPDGMKIIKYVLKDPRFIYIKGNHEDLLCKAINSYYRIKQACNYADKDEIMFHLSYDEDYSLMIYNEGEKTFKDWLKSKYKIPLYYALKDLPTCISYKNKQGQIVFLSHAGFTLHKIMTSAEEVYIWNREHFNEEWDHDFEDSVVVHGHTPIPYMDEFLYGFSDVNKNGALWYCNNHKVNIDCGTVFTGKSVLLNLDTWEEHFIYIPEEVE